ncbi:MAG: TIGR03086 family metal-binding protein [Acidimicrobiia bacterium]
MTEISDRYRRLAGLFTDKVAAVPADRWDTQSPCEEWNSRQLVGHVADTQGMFLGLVGESAGDAPSVDADPLGAWTAARDAVQRALEDPAVAGKEFEGLFGRTRFEDAVDRFLCFDLVVHGWDLARAAGLDDTIALDDARRTAALASQFGESLHSPGVCGPEVEVAADADEQTQLLALLGRTP